MTSPLLPDVESIVVGHLNAHPALATLGAGGERLPVRAVVGNGPFPLVRVSRSGGSEVVPGWLDTAELVVDVFGQQDAPKSTVSLAMRTTLAALRDLDGAITDGGVVTNVATLVGPQWLPEPNGQPRYAAVVAVTAHP